MRKVIIRIGGLVAISATALVTSVSLAVASPATGPAAARVTGPEAISGAVYGKAALANDTHIPLTFAGLVATTDRGFVLGGGNSNTHTLTTPAGRLTVTGVTKQRESQSVNSRTCYFTDIIRQQITFVPGKSTGRFAGASGPGAYQIYFGAYAPRFTSGAHKGQCDLSDNVQPLTKGAVATFLATGVLTAG